MLLHGRIERSSVNGPGNRVVLHFQGCDLGCKGCWNAETHAFKTDKEVDFEELKTWLRDRPNMDGITFSGGEPMQQAQYLFLLTDFIKTERPDWSMIMYTGYTIKELERGAFKWHKSSDGDWQKGTPELWKEISSKLDLVVAGRYNQDKRSSDLPLRGSSNQEIVYLSDRYTESDLIAQEVEFSISDDGLVKITGFPIGWEIDAPLEVKTSKPKTMEDDGDEGELVGA